MNRRCSHRAKQTTQKLVDIESGKRFTSNSINALSDSPVLLRQYLESSITHTFSELLFRLTHERYTEDKANRLWDQIVAHKTNLEERIDRNVGILVAALDYLTNITGDISSPKIIDDLRIEEAADMATRDSLTGLYLRGVFDFSLERMVLEHTRYGKKLSLLLADVDDFKDVNDRFGHQTGDRVLRRMGKLFLASIRHADFPSRYGGEEIAVILPETPVDQAVVLADRLCRHVRECFTAEGPAVTVSIGVSCIHEPDARTAADLLRHADKALYAAKRRGKNRVRRCA